MHSDATQDSMSGSEFVPVDLASMTNANTGHSPGDPATSMYHVTMEDGDDHDAGTCI